ncbi:MAG: HDOD domain-containing protein [Zetaproteobacteria bacterium]|nr:HDOD domain-containing protein [Zetaproteobacteria bacterium]
MQQIYMGRQPIFDRNYQVTSYELLFRSAEGKVDAEGDYMTAKVLVAALMDIGLDRISGHKMVHINASKSFLESGVIEALPSGQVGIEILEDVPVTDHMIKICRELKEKGYHMMLDDVVYAPHLDPLLEIVDVVKVDVPYVKDLTAQVRALRQFKVKLLAEKIETYEDYERCKGLGFDYFQGYFFCKPEIVKGQTMPESKIAVLRALQKVMTATVVNDIQDVVKQDVSLSYRLLKYINSAAFGMRREIESIEQALVLLGLNNARRWLALLSLSALGDGKPLELMRTALYRGYLLESIAKHLKEDETGDDFLLGMFSVLDALLDQPMEKAIEGMALPHEVRKALLRDDASMSYKLKVLYALEHGEWDDVLALSTQYRALRVQDLMGFHTLAWAWADEQVAAIHGG